LLVYAEIKSAASFKGKQLLLLEINIHAQRSVFYTLFVVNCCRQTGNLSIFKISGLLFVSTAILLASLQPHSYANLIKPTPDWELVGGEQTLVSFSQGGGRSDPLRCSNHRRGGAGQVAL
jgi:hypothetical protein